MKKILFPVFIFSCTLSFAVSAQENPVSCYRQNYCSNYLDCARGEYCLNRGDGIYFCMGKGKRNDFCTSSSDCEKKSCKDRGDGLKVCMQ